MNHQNDEYDERSFVQQHKVGIMVVAILAIGGISAVVKAKSGQGDGHKQAQTMVVSVNLPPPPPPPPPPPTPPEPKMEEPKETMIAQEPVAADEQPPEEPAAGESATTGIVGNGPPDGFGLKAGSGNCFGAGRTGHSGSRWGWYASKVQTSVADALRSNPKTRVAAMNIEAKIWADRGGRVIRAQLASSTGSAGLDESIRGDVLVGLQLREPPPQDMPMPMHLRLMGRKTN